MEEHHDKGFKIFGDEAREEETIIPREEDPEPIVIPSSASKPVFVALFAFCLLGALLFFGYYQLSNRINRMESTGTHEIKGLNKEVDARLTGLSGNLAEQNAETTKQIKTLGAQVAALAKQSEKNGSAISSAEKVLAATKQSATSTITSVETSLSALIGRFDKIESNIEQDASGIKKRMDTLSAAIEENRRAVGGVDQIRRELQNLQSRFKSVETEFTTLQTNRFEPEQFSQQITTLDQQLNRRMEATEKQLQQKIASLGDEINALEAMMKSFKNMAGQSAPSGQPGESIIEQEIK